MWRALFVSLLLIPTALPACQCLLTLSACNEVALADRVFIGTVESVEPSFLNRWNPSKSPSLPLSASSRWPGQLKDGTEAFPDLPEYYKRRLAAAKTSDDIARLFYSIIAQGRRVRFKVKTTFRGEKEKEDSDDEEESLEVWTDSGDCGYDFQVGETYLVYADEDEETDRINTSVCYRNRRLSDAGDDLAYLFFFQERRRRIGAARRVRNLGRVLPARSGQGARPGKSKAPGARRHSRTEFRPKPALHAVGPRRQIRL